MPGTTDVSGETLDAVMTLEEIAGYLKVSQKTILRMVQSGKIPGLKVSNQWRFPRTAIDEWLAKRIQHTAGADLDDMIQNGFPLQPLPHLLTPGRIVMPLEPGSKAAVLGQLTAPLEAEGIVANPSDYRADLVAREQMVSTAVGDGLAVPHARVPEKSGLRENCMVIGLSAAGIDFGALDGQPTHVFCLIGSTSTQTHLRLMARAMLLLRLPSMQETLLAASTRDQVVQILLTAGQDTPATQ